MALPTDIFLDNDLPISVGPVELTSFSTGAVSLGTGMTVQITICATEPVGATPINVALTSTLTEVGGTAVYYGGWQGSVLTTHLTSYIGQIVYIVVWSGQDFRVAGAVNVSATRPIE